MSETVYLNDGAGSNVSAKVNSDNQLIVQSRHAARDANALGNAYSAVIEADPNGTDQDFIYLLNSSSTMDLCIYKIRMSTPTADIDVDIKLGVTGTTTSGTAVTPTNMNAGSSNAADVTMEYRDEDLALTGGTVVDTLYIDKDFIGEQEFDYPAEIILAPNTAMVFNNVGTDPQTDINTELFFYFRTAE